MDYFLEDESLIMNKRSESNDINKEELEERRQEMLKDNHLDKYNNYHINTKSILQKDESIKESQPFSYSRPKLKYFLDKSEGQPSAMKNSFKLFQAMTLGDTSETASIHSDITVRGFKYKPKIFEILKKHSIQS